MLNVKVTLVFSTVDTGRFSHVVVSYILYEELEFPNLSVPNTQLLFVPTLLVFASITSPFKG